MLGDAKACHIALSTMGPSAGGQAATLAYFHLGYKSPLFTGTQGTAVAAALVVDIRRKQSVVTAVHGCWG